MHTERMRVVKRRYNNYQYFEVNIQEAMQEDEDQHDSNSDCDSCTDTKIQILVGRLRHDATSDDDTSDGSYVDGVYEQ